MQRLKIVHRTTYEFASEVSLAAHTLLLRPRECHELRIESSALSISPPASLRWHRDIEDNSVAIATFDGMTRRLTIDSEVVVRQYNQAPMDFLVADFAVDYPFVYPPDDEMLLRPYMRGAGQDFDVVPGDWLMGLLSPGETIQTFALLNRLNAAIHQRMRYLAREAPGVQTPAQTLALGCGSCRDLAALFLASARQLGFAARFVSGYLHVGDSQQLAGATHAWAEVYLPGAGWKGFDPTVGLVAGTDHIAVSVARVPDTVPPVAGAFVGPPGADLQVGVRVTALQPPD